MLPGFVERLEVELTKLCPPHLKPKVRCRITHSKGGEVGEMGSKGSSSERN